MEDDQDVLCALGDVTKSDSPASDSFDQVAGYYIVIKFAIKGITYCYKNYTSDLNLTKAAFHNIRA